MNKMKKPAKSAYQTMYLVTENIYSKLENCISEVQKEEIKEMNNSLILDQYRNESDHFPRIPPATTSTHTDERKEGDIVKSIISNVTAKTIPEVTREITRTQIPIQDISKHLSRQSLDQSNFIHQSTPIRQKPGNNSTSSDENEKFLTPTPHRNLTDILDRDISENVGSVGDLEQRNGETPKNSVTFSSAGKKKKKRKRKKTTPDEEREIERSFEGEGEKEEITKRKTLRPSYIYECIFCEKTFYTLNSFTKLHLPTHKNGSKCKVCGVVLKKINFSSHFDTHRDLLQKGKGRKRHNKKSTKRNKQNKHKPFCFYDEW